MFRGGQANRRGAVTVEMALTLPLLFLLLFGALELGHANMLHNTADAAAYEGARRGIVPGATAADCVQAAETVLRVAGVRDVNVSVNPSVIRSETSEIEVSIRIPYARNTVVTPIYTKSLTINRRCRLTRETL